MSLHPERDSIADLPWPEPSGPRPEIAQAIRQQCTRDLCRKRRLSSPSRLGISLFVCAGVIGVLVLLTRHHPRSPGALRAALLGVLGWVLVQALVLFVGLGAPPGKRMGRGVRLAITVLVPVAFFAYLGWAAGYVMPVGQFLKDAHQTGWAAGCGLVTLLFGAAASGCLMFIWRRTDPLTPRLSGAFAGLVGGLTGAVAMGVACPCNESWHLWLSHGLTIVALVCIGGAMGRRWLSP